jgi:hypothetical protein
MTTPVQIGYRDWGRQLAQSDTVIENRVSLMVSDEISAMIPTAGMQYVSLNFFGSGAQLTATIEWYADEIRTIQIGKDACIISDGGTAELSFPVRAPWMRFYIQGAAYPCSMTLLAVMASVPFSSTGQLGDSGHLLSVFGGAIAGLGTVTTTATRTRMGEAHWTAGCGNASWNARLEYLTNAGTWRFLAECESSTTRFIGSVFIPPAPIRSVMVNRLAAATVFNLAVMVRPSYGGS